MSKRSKALHGVMSQLQKEAEDGNVNTGALVRVSKKLKTAFNATSDKQQHIRAYLQEVLVDDPLGGMSIPVKYRHDILECPSFLAQLFRAKRKAINVSVHDGQIPDIWWADFLTGAVCEWFFDDDNLSDPEFLSHARAVVGILIATEDDALPHMEKHLDRLGVAPSKLFAIKNPEGYESGAPETHDILNADCRIIRWLLKDKAYSEADRKQLKEWSFDYSEPEVHKDESWRAALGFRHITDVMSCVLSRALGKSFEEALAMSIAKYPDEPAKTPEREAPA